jgi:hypothetical protein
MVVAVSLFASACDAGGSESRVVPKVPEGVSAEWFANALPLGGIDQTIFDLHRNLELRVGTAIEDCMAELGFEYDHPVPAPATVLFRRYGLLAGDEPVYVVDIEEDEAGGAEPEESDAYIQALFGGSGPVPSTLPVESADGRQVGFTWRADGCLGQAQELAFGSTDEYQRFSSEDLLVQVAISEATEAFWAKPEVEEALGPWRECMVTQGFEAPDRLDFYLLYPWPAGSATQQASTAVAEISCKSVDVLRAVFELDFQMQSEFVEDHAALLESQRGWFEVLGAPVD